MNQKNSEIPRPRFAPEKSFPPYAFTPGYAVHPTHDPQGHSYGRESEDVYSPDPAKWMDCIPYLYGIDLFNHGYYWEAHEAWEDLWNAEGRIGRTADFLKGLIKLAAAGVKVREGVSAGVYVHARGAVSLFRQTACFLEGEDACFMGMCLHELIDFTQSILDDSPLSWHPNYIFNFVLWPREIPL